LWSVFAELIDKILCFLSFYQETCREMLMDFQNDVIAQVELEINPHEGACGICHITLLKLSEAGGKALF
jgi:hypothetical protein